MFSIKTNTIVDYFTGPDFNKTLYYLSKYFVSGQILAKDLTLLKSFSSLEEITGVTQNALKLLGVIDIFNDQFIL